MRIVDAHHHLWDPGVVRYDLLRPEGPLAPLARPFRAADFDAVALANGVSDAIAVEAASAGADIALETDWVLGEIAGSRVTHRFVACAAIEAPDIGARLDALLARAGDRVVGIRRSLEAARPGDLLRPEIVAGVRAVAERGLPFDLVLFADRLGEAVDLVRRVPDARFVLDHLGKPKLERTVPSDWKRDLAAMARLPNVVAKVSGLVTEADGRAWDAALVTPYIAHAADVFGWNRLMFASDWPVVELAGGYARWLDALRTLTDPIGEDARARFFAGTADATYRLASRPG